MGVISFTRPKWRFTQCSQRLHLSKQTSQAALSRRAAATARLECCLHSWYSMALHTLFGFRTWHQIAEVRGHYSKDQLKFRLTSLASGDQQQNITLIEERGEYIYIYSSSRNSENALRPHVNEQTPLHTYDLYSHLASCPNAHAVGASGQATTSRLCMSCLGSDSLSSCSICSIVQAGKPIPKTKTLQAIH